MLVVDENNRAVCTDEQLKQADVAIEFTTPTVAVDNYNWCFRNHVPVVSGTTGWLERWSEVMMSCLLYTSLVILTSAPNFHCSCYN